MSDPRFYTGEPKWDHDDECSLLNLCAVCLQAEEDRAAEDAAHSAWTAEEQARRA